MKFMPECTDPELGALLHAYERNILPEADVQRFEIHLMKCEHCWQEVQSFKSEAALLATNGDVKEVVKQADATYSVPESTARKIWRYLWPDSPIIFRPALAYLLVLVMIVPAYYGLWLANAGQDKSMRAQMITLVPGRSTSDAVFKISSGYYGLIKLVYPDAVPGGRYRVVVMTTDSIEIVRYENFDGFDKYGSGKVSVPLTMMKPGTYRLIVSDPVAESLSPLLDYRFTVEP
jgi:hypothetical protein